VTPSGIEPATYYCSSSISIVLGYWLNDLRTIFTTHKKNHTHTHAHTHRYPTQFSVHWVPRVVSPDLHLHYPYVLMVLRAIKQRNNIAFTKTNAYFVQNVTYKYSNRPSVSLLIRTELVRRRHILQATPQVFCWKVLWMALEEKLKLIKRDELGSHFSGSWKCIIVMWIINRNVNHQQTKNAGFLSQNTTLLFNK
jgi:hypothetical protein